MKNKTDTHSDQRLANIKQAAKEAGLPERITLPNPAHLAQIAAGFGIHTRPATAVKQAVTLFLHATAFRAKHDNTPALDLAMACGDHELASQLRAFNAEIDRTHLLEPDKRQDEARRELGESGLKLSKAKSVLENLHQFYRLAHMRHFLREKKIPVTSRDGEPLWVLGTTESESDEGHSKLNESQCRMVTRSERDHRTEVIAKQHGWPEEDEKRDWIRELASITERRPDGRIVYHVPSFWLGDLLQWKKSRKHSGGVKSQHKTKSSKNP